MYIASFLSPCGLGETGFTCLDGWFLGQAGFLPPVAPLEVCYCCELALGGGALISRLN
jgi:hypothetical protein